MPREESQAQELFAQVLPQATQSDPVLLDLAKVLEEDALPVPYDDPLFQLLQVGQGQPWQDREARPGEVIVYMLLIGYLYDWSQEETARQVQESLVISI